MTSEWTRRAAALVSLRLGYKDSNRVGTEAGDQGDYQARIGSHRLKSQQDGAHDGYDLRNLVSLCPSCHHKQEGRRHRAALTGLPNWASGAAAVTASVNEHDNAGEDAV